MLGYGVFIYDFEIKKYIRLYKGLKARAKSS